MPQYQTYLSKDTPAADDILLILDTSDYSDGSTGTTKSTRVGAIAGHGHLGYSASLRQWVDTASLQASVDLLMAISYAAPSISLGVAPAPTLREKGDTVTSVALTAVIGKRSNDITAVAFFRNDIQIDAVATPQAGGGSETYTDNADFSDTTTYTATASDGTSQTQANTITYPFVYPYYYGVGMAGLADAQINTLTKAIIAQSPAVAVTTQPSGQVFYFAYPASYGPLTSILDANGFETLSDYNQRTASVTGLDGTAQSYRVYESKYPTTTPGNFTNTYKQ